MNEDNFNQHNELITCPPQKTKAAVDCTYCGKEYSNSSHRNRHEIEVCRKENKRRPTLLIDNVTCRKCFKRFKDRTELDKHRRREHLCEEGLRNYPWGALTPPWEKQGEIDEKFKEVYLDNKEFILSPHIPGKIRMTYNFPTNNLEGGVDELIRYVHTVMETETKCVKMELSMGIILYHTEEKKYRYFAPNTNNKLIEKPVALSNANDLDKFCNRLRSVNIEDYIRKQRPNTKYRPVYCTNVCVYCYSTEYMFGVGGVEKHIKNDRSLKSLDCNDRGVLYDDNLCIFRNLCEYYGELDIDEGISRYYSMWREYGRQNSIRVPNDMSKFRGIPLQLMFEFQKCFGIHVNIYYKGKDKVVTPIYLSLLPKHRSVHDSDCSLPVPSSRSKILNMNLSNDHLSYVIKFGNYAKKYGCGSCARHFPNLTHYKRHVRNCGCRTRYVYPGGFHKRSKNVFEELAEYGISCEYERQFYPWYAVYDFEALLMDHSCEGETKTEYTKIHHPVSVSVASNVGNFEEAHTIVNQDCDKLIEDFVSYLSSIQERTFTLAKERWGDVIDQIDKLVEKWKPENNESEENEKGKHTDGFIDESKDLCDDDGKSENDESKQKENGVCTDLCDSNECWNNNEYEECDDYDDYIDEQDGDDGAISAVYDGIGCDVWDEENDVDKWFDFSDEEEGEYDHDTDSIADDEYNHELEDDSEQGDEGAEQERERKLKIIRKKIDSKQVMYKTLKALREKFMKYCSSLIVLGFNSSSYDINLIRTRLAFYLDLTDSREKPYIVKRNNAYLCISNRTFKFLDIQQYLSQGTSYDSFLKGFQAGASKGFLCYEYLDSFEKLNETRLPDYSHFYSSLKCVNVLDEEYQAWNRLNDDEKRKYPTPPTGEERYASLQQIWEEKQMKTLKDYLIHYNSLDVIPFVTAVANMLELFKKDGILDPFKDSLSAPGLARSLLYQTAAKNNVNFALFGKEDVDLYHTVQKNICGGPSIIYHRYHSKGETNIRNDPDKKCESIHGYDANSLYLYAIGQPQPCGGYVRRYESEKFKPKISTKHRDQYIWMDWISSKENIKISHYVNSGKEKRIGPYLVDGFCGNTVYEVRKIFIYLFSDENSDY